jgi:hypothetical protein
LVEGNSEKEIAVSMLLRAFAGFADPDTDVDREEVTPMRRPPVVEISVRDRSPPLIEALVDLDFGIFGRELEELKPKPIRLDLLCGEPMIFVAPPSFPQLPRCRLSHGRSS